MFLFMHCAKLSSDSRAHLPVILTSTLVKTRTSMSSSSSSPKSIFETVKAGEILEGIKRPIRTISEVA